MGGGGGGRKSSSSLPAAGRLRLGAWLRASAGSSIFFCFVCLFGWKENSGIFIADTFKGLIKAKLGERKGK